MPSPLYSGSSFVLLAIAPASVGRRSMSAGHSRARASVSGEWRRRWASSASGSVVSGAAGTAAALVEVNTEISVRKSWQARSAFRRPTGAERSKRRTSHPP